MRFTAFQALLFTNIIYEGLGCSTHQAGIAMEVGGGLGLHSPWMEVNVPYEPFSVGDGIFPSIDIDSYGQAYLGNMIGGHILDSPYAGRSLANRQVKFFITDYFSLF